MTLPYCIIDPNFFMSVGLYKSNSNSNLIGVYTTKIVSSILIAHLHELFEISTSHLCNESRNGYNMIGTMAAGCRYKLDTNSTKKNFQHRFIPMIYEYLRENFLQIW